MFVARYVDSELFSIPAIYAPYMPLFVTKERKLTIKEIKRKRKEEAIEKRRYRKRKNYLRKYGFSFHSKDSNGSKYWI